MNNTHRICIGKIASPHGVKGEMKLLLYLEDVSLLRSSCLVYDDSGKPLSITSFRQGPKDFFLIKLEEITSREDADSLKGIKLYLDRSDLPENLEEETYYIEDLKGLRVIPHGKPDLQDNRSTVTAVHNFGAGDILEIRLENKTFFIPFRKEAIPDVSLKEGWVIVNPAFLLKNESKSQENNDVES